MATVTKTFTWDSDNEGFTLSETSGAGTMQRDTSNGSPTAGSLQQIGESGRNKVSEGQALIDDGTWITIFGVPSGATVNSIQVEDVRTYVGLTHSTGSLDNVDFSVHIYETTRTTSVTGTDPIWTRNSTAADSSWNQAGQQTAQNVTSTYQAASTVLDMVIHINTDNANDPNAQWSGHLDYLSITVDYTAGSTTYSGSFTADAITKASQSGSISADAIVKANSGELTVTADAVKEASSGTKTFTADAWVFYIGQGSITADAITKASMSGSATADAIKLEALSGSVTADAIKLETISPPPISANAVITAGASSGSGSVTADAFISLIGRAVWVSPANMSGISASPTLVFEMPIAPGNMHFQIELDTDSGFSDPTVVQSPGTGWEYHDGGGWQAIPAAGVPNTYSGNEARYTVQSPLSQATWYRRVRAGVIS